MKKFLLIFILFFYSIQLESSIKFSPYIGMDYNSKMGSSVKPILGMDFSYEFDNGIEFGLGTYFSKTKVAKKGDELIPDYIIDFYPEVKENPSYLFVKYNYAINDNSKISPYAKIGMLNTSIYNNYNYNYHIISEDDVKRDIDIKKNGAILYGNNFYALGLQYSYKTYYLSLEYKVRNLKQENSNLHDRILYDKVQQTGVFIDRNNSYSSKTLNSHSISFMIGYIFDSKNKIRSENNKERRYRNVETQQELKE